MKKEKYWVCNSMTGDFKFPPGQGSWICGQFVCQISRQTDLQHAAVHLKSCPIIIFLPFQWWEFSNLPLYTMGLQTRQSSVFAIKKIHFCSIPRNDQKQSGNIFGGQYHVHTSVDCIARVGCTERFFSSFLVNLQNVLHRKYIFYVKFTDMSKSRM